MKMKLMKTVICRTPAFSIQDSLKGKWEELKEKIRESSPGFYLLIEDISKEDIPKLGTKMGFTLWKYFSRAKFRATPFGSYSALSLVPVCQGPEPHTILSVTMQAHSFADWSQKNLTENAPLDVNDQELLFYANNTAYRVMDQIRYVRLIDGTFEIALLDFFEELGHILALCSSLRSLQEITSTMEAKFYFTPEETISLVEQMVSAGLLLHSYIANITGEDYFTRIHKSTAITGPAYVISTRKHLSGGLDAGKLSEVPQMIDFLSKILPQRQNPHLQEFIKAFQHRFQGQQVPLSQVMDPEIGIGYGNMEQGQQLPAIEALKRSRSQSAAATSLCYGQLHSFLLNQMMSQGEVQLQAFNSGELLQVRPLPNTLSLMARFWNQRLVVMNIGGATANSLLGRFTLIGGEYEEMGREIAGMEQAANPDCLFFDIAYRCEESIDNVNRRKGLYQLELPILSWPGVSDPLDFNDILVSVVGGEVVLLSKKHQKRLIPRIASAYNYTRSDLSAYRFLCDLQHQGISTDLSFDLRSFFPGLDHYPRASYGNIILSAAKWKIPQEFTSAYSDDELNGKKVALRAWLATKGISSRLLLGEADTTLCVDPSSEVDLQAMVQYCRQKSGTVQYISEALINDSPQVQGQDWEPYAAQFICNYSHAEEIYTGHHPKVEGLSGTTKHAIFPPASEWIYYQLYCYPTKSDQLLTEQIATFLKTAGQYINKWFFIRYNDPSPHLRLRLHLKDPSLSHQLTLALKELLEPYLYSGQLVDFSIASYRRELERYGPDRICQVEQYFHLDSEHALWAIQRSVSTDQLYSCALDFIEQVFLPFIGPIDKQLLFVVRTAGRFAAESGLGPSGFAALNQQFKKFTEDTKAQPGLKNSPALPKCKKQLEAVLSGTDLPTTQNLVGDLVHMHINRLFSSDQRLHETVVYHYLQRQLLARRARKALAEKHECLPQNGSAGLHAL